MRVSSFTDLVTSTLGKENAKFMPFIAHTILENGEIFASAIDKLSDTIINISANKNVLSRFVENSYAIATLLTPILGFATVEKLLQESKSKDMGFLSLILEKKLITKEKLDKLLTPEVMASPGLPIIEEDI
jgi:aspartate ammonia-lyase